MARTQECLPQNSTRDWRRALWALGPLGFGLLAFETISPSIGPDENELLEWAPWVTPTAAGAAAVSWIGLAIVAAATRGRRGLNWPALIPLALLLFGGAFVALFKEGFGWRPISRWTGSASSEHVARDGTTYRGFVQRWLEGGVTIGRRERVGWFSSTYRLLTVGDLAGPIVVIPAAADRSSPLVVSNGCVAAVWSTGVCPAAATLDGRPLVGRARWNRERAGWMFNQSGMSVFRLIGPNDALDQEGVQLVESHVSAAGTDSSMFGSDAVPGDDDLLEALDSPNSGIRSAAARFVRAGTRRLYPKASDRLDQ